MRATLAELAQLLEAEIIGDGQTTVRGLASLDEAKAGDLAFVADDRSTRGRLAASHASAILVAPDMPVDRPALRVPDPYLGFIRLVEEYFPQQHPAWGIDDLAVLAPDVVVGQRVSVGPYVVIGEGTRLEGRCRHLSRYLHRTRVPHRTGMRLIRQREPVLSSDAGAWGGHSQRRGHWRGWLRVPPLGRRGLP